MIKIALVDDDEELQKELKNQINRYFEESNISFCVSSFFSGEEFLSNYKVNSFDIIFMDIQMKKLNGIETCVELRKLDESVIIIFLTNLAQYAINGYEVNAFDFVIKPINYYVLSMKLSRAITKLKNEKNAFKISFSYQNMKYFLEINSLKYVEVTGHKLVFYATTGIYYTYDLSLSKLEKTLIENNIDYFCKCNNYLLVNLNFVNSISGLNLNIDNKQLPISRSKRNQLMEKLNKLYSQGQK